MPNLLNSSTIALASDNTFVFPASFSAIRRFSLLSNSVGFEDRNLIPLPDDCFLSSSLKL